MQLLSGNKTLESQPTSILDHHHQEAFKVDNEEMVSSLVEDPIASEASFIASVMAETGR